MKLLLRRWTLFVLILCSLALATSNAQVGGQVIRKIEIRHVGPPAASDALIRANIRVKEGDTYTATSVDDDVRSLLATGYFHNVKVVLEPATDGLAVNCLFNPGQTGHFRNHDHRKHQVQQKEAAQKGHFQGRRAAQRTEAVQRRAGDAQALRESRLSAHHRRYLPPVIDSNTGRASITFEVVEAPKIKIKEVEFVGAEAFKQKKLRKQVKTKRRWMFSWLTGSGVVKDEQLEDDKEKLADFYREAGYIDFELKDVKTERTDRSKARCSQIRRR
jgi:outer membrane protein insertion porin family